MLSARPVKSEVLRVFQEFIMNEFLGQAPGQMVLGTFAETKVPRPPGRDPAILKST